MTITKTNTDDCIDNHLILRLLRLISISRVNLYNILRLGRRLGDKEEDRKRTVWTHQLAHQLGLFYALELTD